MSLLVTILQSMCLALFLPAIAAAAQPLEPNTDGLHVQYFHKFYAGKIADRYGFTMDLKSLDGVLSGTYRYNGKQVELYLQGKIDPSGSFTMDEFYGSKRTGTFTGEITANRIVGLWQSADGTKKGSFEADQTSEIKIGSKKEILTKAIGDYSLASISGAGGANGMWDTWRTKGKWESNISGISGGMRQGNKIKLTRADAHLLDTMAVRVDADLTVRFLAGGTTLLTIPYRESGMQFNIKRPHSSVVEDDLKRFSSGTTVLDEQLYLLAQDDVDYAEVISGNFEATVGDIVIVSYAVVADIFEVNFVVGNCCGGSVFTFERRHH